MGVEEYMSKDRDEEKAHLEKQIALDKKQLDYSESMLALMDTQLFGKWMKEYVHNPTKEARTALMACDPEKTHFRAETIGRLKILDQQLTWNVTLSRLCNDKRKQIHNMELLLMGDIPENEPAN